MEGINEPLFPMEKVISQGSLVCYAMCSQYSTWRTVWDFTPNLTILTKSIDYTNYLLYNSKKPLVKH